MTLVRKLTPEEELAAAAVSRLSGEVVAGQRYRYGPNQRVYVAVELVHEAGEDPRWRMRSADLREILARIDGPKLGLVGFELVD